MLVEIEYKMFYAILDNISVMNYKIVFNDHNTFYVYQLK